MTYLANFGYICWYCDYKIEDTKVRIRRLEKEEKEKANRMKFPELEGGYEAFGEEE